MDSLNLFPSLILVIVIAAVFGPQISYTVVADAIVFVPTYHRAAQALWIKELETVAAAGIQGGERLADALPPHRPQHARLVHPGCNLQCDRAIQTAAGLSFLGLGAQPPNPDCEFDL
jgi:ABC-type dipeptide/oligopeptide/nickel transport system permease subunit